MSIPDLVLHYPSDAYDHFQHIHKILQRWTNSSRQHCQSNYCGPWIENHWIHHFGNKSSNCLSDTYGPYIPLLVPWTDLWVNSAGRGYHYPKKFTQTLRRLLRRNVAYITVSQSDLGLVGSNEFAVPSNILVLSAGGYGHVPIPLLKQSEPLLREKPGNRTWLTSFVGSLADKPHYLLRRTMHDYMLNASNATYKYYYGTDGSHWRRIMQSSYTSLCPRGFGRTSFHLMETLQMGLVPIYIYDRIPWIPYQTLYMVNWGFLTSITEFPKLISQLRNMQIKEFLAKEDNIALHRESHFSIHGILHHISRFMLSGGDGDLECTALPNKTNED